MADPTPCPRCGGTGIAHNAPYIAPDIWTMTACDCPAGEAMVRRAAEQMKAMKETKDD